MALKKYCLIFIQLYVGALTCRTDISFGNILRTFLRSVWTASYCLKVLYINQTLLKFTTDRKQALSKSTWHYSQSLNLCPLWNPQKVTDSTDALLAA